MLQVDESQSMDSGGIDFGNVNRVDDTESVRFSDDCILVKAHHYNCMIYHCM